MDKEQALPAPLIECIPNFSEGRRLEVIEAIREALCAAPGVLLLDHSWDADHNRSVFTLVGDTAGVEAAAYAAIAKAAELIDMEQHTGQHPRIGAADVVPFVPLGGATMKDCVQLARRLGQRVGEELNIPVYLYGEAAARSERRDLAQVRTGGYAGLKAEIGRDPGRAPDFGPRQLGRAGATVVGARRPLVAYNVYLDTEDAGIARKIARTIRASSGGLPGVKALGLLAGGRAQVSMNLTDFHQTGVHTVVGRIGEEAEKYGVRIERGELIGLIPQQAYEEAAASGLKLDIRPEQVLETRLRGKMAQADKAGGGH